MGLPTTGQAESSPQNVLKPTPLPLPFLPTPLSEAERRFDKSLA